MFYGKEASSTTKITSFNLFGLVGKLGNFIFFSVLLSITGEEALLVFPGQENHSQRDKLHCDFISQVTRNVHKMHGSSSKRRKFYLQILNPCSAQDVHCNLYFIELSELSYFPHLQTKCHCSGVGITKI